MLQGGADKAKPRDMRTVHGIQAPLEFGRKILGGKGSIVCFMTNRRAQRTQQRCFVLVGSKHRKLNQRKFWVIFFSPWQNITPTKKKTAKKKMRTKWRTYPLPKANLTKPRKLLNPRNCPTKPKGVTPKMKALDEYFLMVVFTLMLNRLFANAMFNLDRETWQRKG